MQYSTRMNDYATFKKYSKLVNDQSAKAATLRSLLQFKKVRPSISIDEVEPAENFCQQVLIRLAELIADVRGNARFNSAGADRDEN